MKHQTPFFQQHIFRGLTNLNDRFDARSIPYFSEADFRIVLERAEKHQIKIHGIEPWKNGLFYDVLSAEDFQLQADDPKWYWQAFDQSIKTGEPLLNAASFEVPGKS